MTSCKTQRTILIAGVALLVGAAGCQTTAAAPQVELTSQPPDLSVGADQYPGADAINLRWVTQWTLAKDGTVHRRDQRWLKLLSRRPIRAEADPRIDFCEGQDKLVIHTARTHLPDGTVLPVPDYSYNLAAPDDVGGWPYYARWCQQVICFSGIQDNAVMELDYEVVTQPGVVPWMEGDLRIDSDYPTVERIILVTVPEGTPIRHRVDGLNAAEYSTRSDTDGGMSRYTWLFPNLSGAPAEPQSLPWRERCPRFHFTTCGSVEQWVSAIVERVTAAAEPDDAIRAFVKDAVEDAIDPTEQVARIAKKLQDSFNTLASPKTYRGLQCRPASEAFRSNCGSPLEAAAVWAAALMAADIPSSIEVAVGATTWNETVPTASELAGVVVIARTPDGTVMVNPQTGVFRSPGGWGRHWLLGASPGSEKGGPLRKTYIEARGEKTTSRMYVSGKVTIDGDGHAAGEWRVHLTGAFYDPAALETSGQQERLLERLVGRIASGFHVTSHVIATLSDESLRATVNVASKEPLVKAGSQHVLVLGDGPVCLADFPMPLDQSYRATDVGLAGRFVQDVNVMVELPDGWSADILPATVPTVKGAWGSAGQRVEVTESGIRVHQSIDVSQETISPEAFKGLRDVVNTLRADASRVLTCGP